MSLKSLLIENTIFQGVGHIVSLGIGLATTILLSRYLGVERFGQFNYIFAFFYFFFSGLSRLLPLTPARYRNLAIKITAVLTKAKAVRSRSDFILMAMA